jgi:hypothetical protein
VGAFSTIFSIVSFAAGYFVNQVARSAAYADALLQVSGHVVSSADSVGQAKANAIVARSSAEEASLAAARSKSEVDAVLIEIVGQRDRLKKLLEESPSMEEVANELLRLPEMQSLLIERIAPMLAQSDKRIESLEKTLDLLFTIDASGVTLKRPLVVREGIRGELRIYDDNSESHLSLRSFGSRGAIMNIGRGGGTGTVELHGEVK